MVVLHELFYFVWGILRCSSACNDGLCLVPRTPSVAVMRGLTFYLAVLSVWTKGLC